MTKPNQTAATDESQESRPAAKTQKMDRWAKYEVKVAARRAASDHLYDQSFGTPEWFEAKKALQRATRNEDRAFKNYMVGR